MSLAHYSPTLGGLTNLFNKRYNSSVMPIAFSQEKEAVSTMQLFTQLETTLEQTNRFPDLSVPKYEGDPYSIRWFTEDGVLNFIGYWEDDKEGLFTQHKNGQLIHSEDFYGSRNLNKFI